MDSDVDPLLLPRSKLAYAQNATLRGDFFRQRPPYRKINLGGPVVVPSIVVTVQSNLSGIAFMVDGITYTSAQTFNWLSGSIHTLSVQTQQILAGGDVCIYNIWSDGGTPSHNVSPTVPTTYTVDFTNTGEPLVVPSSPNGVMATGGDLQIILAWTASATATSYNVLRSTTSGGETSLATGITGTGYTDNAVANGTTYYYKVTATNSVGTSPPSREASATPVLTIPNIPTGFSAIFTGSEVQLSWNPSAGATSYIWYVAFNHKLYNTTVSGTSATFTPTPGTICAFWVSAGNSAGYSPETAAIELTIPPASPTGLSGRFVIEAHGLNPHVSLSWTAVSGATSYNILRSTVTGQETLLGTTANLFYGDSYITVGVEYFYVVQAVNMGGASPNSSEVGVAT
jgi:fibronectin type 3 domain-containing protein